MAKKIPAWARMSKSPAQKRDLSISQLQAIRGGGFGVNAGVMVNPETALTFTAVYAAINTLATDVASLPLAVYRRSGETRISEPAPDHYLTELLECSPDGETTPIRHRQASMGHVCSRGNSYSEIVYGKGGQVKSLPLLDPRETEPKRHPGNGTLYYDLGKGRTLPPYKILHVAGLGFDGLKGYGPIALARQAVGLGLAAEAFGASFFGNGSKPGGVLELPYTLQDKAAVDRLKDDWGEEHGGPYNASKVAVLEGGAKFSPFTIPPEDAQFLQTRQFQVVEIARIFRLPPHKLGDYSQAHLANLEQSNLDYLTTALMPWLVQIEQEMNRKLLTEDERRAGYHVKHDMTAFMRGDSKTRIEVNRSYVESGIFSRNQVLAQEGMPPVKGGDVLTLQVNMTTLDRLIEPPAQTPIPEQKPPQ